MADVGRRCECETVANSEKEGQHEVQVNGVVLFLGAVTHLIIVVIRMIATRDIKMATEPLAERLERRDALRGDDRNDVKAGLHHSVTFISCVNSK